MPAPADAALPVLGDSTPACDLATRKSLEEERRYVMAGAHCLLWYADIEDGGEEYLYWQIHIPDMEAAQRFLPLDMQEGESYKDASYRCRVPEDRAACDRLGTASVRAGRSYEQEFRCVCADGTVHWLHEDIRIEAVEEGRRWRAVAVCTDVTERKRYEQQIEDLNKRLQRAMQETHHRVKNNLQLITAMLDMAIMDHTDALPISEVRRLVQQVTTLASLHDLLTHSAQFTGDQASTVSSQAVLNRLLRNLKETARHHRFAQQIEDVRLSMRQAGALALAANELVSNAVKHGREFVGLTFRAEGNCVCLQIEDDGAGVPAAFDYRASANTGLMLVENVAGHDLNGTLTFANRAEGGARVRLTFPLAETP